MTCESARGGAGSALIEYVDYCGPRLGVIFLKSVNAMAACGCRDRQKHLTDIQNDYMVAVTTMVLFGYLKSNRRGRTIPYPRRAHILTT